MTGPTLPAESTRPCDCKFCQHNAEKRCECEPCQYIRRNGWDGERSHPPLLVDGVDASRRSDVGDGHD